MFRASINCSIATAITALAASAAGAEVTEYEDKADWMAAAQNFTTIDFVGVGHGTLITDQYEDLGVVFTDGDDYGLSNVNFMDEWGVSGDGDINLTFDSPQYHIGLDYGGGLSIELYQGFDLLYVSSDFGGAGPFFAGLISSQPFDRVLLRDWVDSRAIVDNLHFGVPAPGAWYLMVLAGLARRRRRRS
jgi:MYXO-CTERM domain-containing protein